MADDAVAVVRALYQAVDDRDHDTIRRCVADDLRWRQASRAVPAAGEELVGGEALIDRVLRPFEENWDDFTEEIEQMQEGGGLVVATGTYRGTYRPTGRRLEAEFCHMLTVRDGRIQTFRQFTDTAAFAAVTSTDPAS
jgi:uncharacterized protein